MIDEAKIEDAVEAAADKAGIDEKTIDGAVANAKSLLDRAQAAIGDAVDTVIGAVKEHPVAAAGIAAGATAAVAGVAYGAGKLRSDSTDKA